MELVTPNLGLVIWMTVAFMLLVFILGKYAWKPILKALDEREQSIDDALKAADKAKAEMTRLNQESEALMAKARTERDAMLKEAKELSTKAIDDAKNAAQTEGAKMIAKAKAEIDLQKSAAISELKNQVASISIGIAEKILKKELANNDAQQNLVAEMLKDVKMN